MRDLHAGESEVKENVQVDRMDIIVARIQLFQQSAELAWTKQTTRISNVIAILQLPNE